MDPLFSRRDFLKLAGTGLLASFLTGVGSGRARASSASQARMTLSGIILYQDPSFKAKKLHAFGRDEVVKITAEVDGDAGNPFNSKWFQVNHEGYAYSGWLQPVESLYQKPSYQIAEMGQLGEVTVPFSETRLTPSLWSKRGYRIYYGTTHWVRSVVTTAYEKGIWYEIYDSHLQESFYAPATDLRLIPEQELAPLSPGVPEEQKYIYVDTATQSVTAFEEQQAVLTARCSSGGKGTRTPLGEFFTYHKGPTIHMTNDGAADAGRGYDLPGVPWVSFFTGSGISFHGTYWHNDYGQPRSHGCVNLLPADARFIYRWSRPVVPAGTQYLHLPGQGTRVEIISSQA